MESRFIEPGKDYAIREPVKHGEPFQHVRAVERVRGGKWRVEWIDPNPGLVDYLKSSNFIVPWRERRALERDEKRQAVLAAVSEPMWDGPDGPVTEAVNLVFETTGENHIYVYRDGVLDADPNELARVRDRAGLPEPDEPLAFTDRQGVLHLPFSYALTLAKAFAAAEPNTVLLDVDVREREYELETRDPGGSSMLDLLNRYRPQWALVRQWAGHDQAVAAREEEIRRLQDLLSRTIWELRRPDVDPEVVARRLDRAMRAG